LKRQQARAYALFASTSLSSRLPLDVAITRLLSFFAMHLESSAAWKKPGSHRGSLQPSEQYKVRRVNPGFAFH
jgi:hypothetical protein